MARHHGSGLSGLAGLDRPGLRGLASNDRTLLNGLPCDHANGLALAGSRPRRHAGGMGAGLGGADRGFLSDPLDAQGVQEGIEEAFVGLAHGLRGLIDRDDLQAG